tara:strand:+ start:716 stop:1033 length:318 start_codon:yes stop_codon:yes gene_type:complete
MKFELSSKSRIEKVIFDKNNFYELLDEYLECDGGVIVKIKDRDMIKKDYIEMGFGEDEMLFYIDKGNDEYEDKNINDVVCKLDIKEGDGGYSVFYDENKNYLIEE